MHSDRRKFLHHLISIGTLSPMFSKALLANPNSLVPGNYLVGGMVLDPSGKPIKKGDKQSKKISYLTALHQRGDDVIMVEVPHTIHSVVRHPFKPWTVVAFPKKPEMSQAFEINLAERRISKLIDNGAAYGFYGHGAFSGDGKTVFVAEYKNTKNTYVTIRDAKDYRVLDQLKTAGNDTHEISFFPGEKLFLASHRSRVEVIEVASRKVIETYTEKQNHEMFGHHAIVDEQTAYLLTTSMDRQTEAGGSMVYQVHPGKAKQTKLIYPKPIIGETLSYAYHQQSETLAVTHPDASVVTFWHAKTGKFRSQIQVEGHSNGIALSGDQQSFMIGTRLGALYEVQTKNLRVIKRRSGLAYFSNSSHMLSTHLS